MSELTLLDAIDSAVFRVRERIAAAIVAGNDLEAGRIIRAEAERQIAERRELDAPSEVSDAELAAAFRDVYAAERDYKLREQWAEITADVRKHEAGE